ncbi:MAG: CDP-diacylglycerol--serine O-phosphatidyltransferase, partial [Nitrospirota bacterium]
LILFFTFSLAALMVSTLRFHGAKELDFSKRKPFWILVAIAVTIAVIIMHPEIALFVFAMIYLVTGIIENIILFLRRRKGLQKAGEP